jgi:hypothetical protein
MIRSSIALCFMLALVLTKVAPADTSRTGGVIILPSALPFGQPTYEVRAQHTFNWGENQVYQLPANLGPNVLVIASILDGLPITIGRIEQGILTVAGGELRTLAGAGVGSFHFTMVDTQQRTLRLTFDLSAKSRVTVDVR